MGILGNSSGGGGGITNLADQTISNPTITGTVTASQVTGIPVVLAKWGVPVILASSGTMGNNGAVSAMTALPTTYSGGAWLYLPANAIQAGSSAGFYWFKGSSTTAGTVYNSTFDGLSVPGLGTETAFVSTGPGAFTGISSGEIVAATVTVPAGAIGPNGLLDVWLDGANNTAAGNKIFRVRYSGGAGTIVFTSTRATDSFISGNARIRNTGVTGAQKYGSLANANGGVAAAGTAYAAVDTTVATTAVLTLEKATATNHAILDGGNAFVVYGS
jgi:hypothetical protein